MRHKTNFHRNTISAFYSNEITKAKRKELQSEFNPGMHRYLQYYNVWILSTSTLCSLLKWKENKSDFVCQIYFFLFFPGIITTLVPSQSWDITKMLTFHQLKSLTQIKKAPVASQAPRPSSWGAINQPSIFRKISPSQTFPLISRR